jgi:hypothetical protein
VRAAGAVLVVGAVLTALCTGYWMVRYHVHGEFDHAHPHGMGAVGMLDAGAHAGPPGAQRGMGMMGPA